jgi:hypothetical protein
VAKDELRLGDSLVVKKFAFDNLVSVEVEDNQDYLLRSKKGKDGAERRVATKKKTKKLLSFVLEKSLDLKVNVGNESAIEVHVKPDGVLFEKEADGRMRVKIPEVSVSRFVGGDSKVVALLKSPLEVFFVSAQENVVELLTFCVLLFNVIGEGNPAE